MPPSIAGALACNHRVGVYDFDPAFDDGSRVADPKSFEIVSQSDLVRFLHDRRDDERIRGFLRLTAREVGFLGGRARERAREAGHARTARDARETRDARESRAAILSSSSSSSRRSPTPGSPPPAPALRPGIPLPPVLPYRGVLCVPDEETSALDAFALMDAEGVSALGVCDDAYRIVANVSVSDLRGLTPDTVDRLALPIVEFLRVQRGDAQGGSGYGDVRVVSCGVDDTVGRVVELLATRDPPRVRAFLGRTPAGDGHAERYPRAPRGQAGGGMTRTRRERLARARDEKKRDDATNDERRTTSDESRLVRRLGFVEVSNARRRPRPPRPRPRRASRC